MMQRYCICGKMIAGKRVLCPECSLIYGRTAKEWPAWLRFWVNDTVREIKQEIEIDKHEISFADKNWNNL